MNATRDDDGVGTSPSLQPTRRAVLAGALAAAATGILTPHVGYARPTPAVRFGVIGFAPRAWGHLRHLASSPRHEVVAVADRSAWGRGRAAAIAPRATLHTDPLEVIHSPDVDALLLTHPADGALVAAAVRSGKHVLYDSEAALPDLPAVLARGQALVHTSPLLHGRAFVRLRRLVAAGHIGPVADVRVFKSRPAAGDRTGDLFPAHGHYFLALDYLADGRPVIVSATVGRGRGSIGPADYGTASLAYDGLTADLNLCMFGPLRFDLRVRGRDATLRATASTLTLETSRSAEVVKLEAGNPLASFHDDFIDRLNRTGIPVSNVNDALAAARTVRAAVIAATQHKDRPCASVV